MNGIRDLANQADYNSERIESLRSDLDDLDLRVDSAEAEIEALERVGRLALEEVQLSLADRVAQVEEAVATLVDVGRRERGPAPGRGQGGTSRG